MSKQAIPLGQIKTAVKRADGFERQSQKIIKKYSLMASAGCLLNINVVDLIATSLTQTLLVRDLCKLYGIIYKNHLQNVALWAGMGSIITIAVTDVVKKVLNDRKINDSSIDFTGAAVAGIYTATLGAYYHIHLRDGGTLEDVSLSSFADFFIEEIKKGDLSLGTFTNPETLLNLILDK